MLDKFNKLNMTNWKCIPKDISVDIYGKYSSDKFSTLDIILAKCTNSSLSDSRPCATQT